MHDLAHKVLDHLRHHELLKPGDRVGVAVSGGSDSVGLLRLLLELRKELGVVLSVVHFNHKLRGAESDGDEQFVADLAGRYKLQLYLRSADVRAHAAAERLSIETAARELRYEFFVELLRAGEPETESEHGNLPEKHSVHAPQSSHLDKISTGHTLDDQAETVLMRVLRGTGTGGLGGIYPRLVVEGTEADTRHGEPAEIIRPLLGVRRRELEQYLTALGQLWREDATNQDLKHTRNRVRHTLLPLLERAFNPGIVSSLSDLAEIARAEEDYWESEASGWMGTTVQWFSAETEPPKPAYDLVQLTPAGVGLSPNDASSARCGPQRLNASVDLLWLLAEPLALQRRVIKGIGEVAKLPLEFKHVEEILRFAAEKAITGKELGLPLGWRVSKEERSLVFLSPECKSGDEKAIDYEYRLPVPGQVHIPELGASVQAIRATPEAMPSGYNPEHTYDAGLLSNELTVRNWRPGDRFWPLHTKSPKKIKELLQKRHVAGSKRKLWPVALSGDKLVWVRGFPCSAEFWPREKDRPVVLIREIPGGE